MKDNFTFSQILVLRAAAKGVKEREQGEGDAASYEFLSQPYGLFGCGNARVVTRAKSCFKLGFNNVQSLRHPWFVLLHPHLGFSRSVAARFRSYSHWTKEAS